MSTITVQDIFNQLQDYLGNYQTSTIDPGQKLRAINRSTEYIKRRFGFPCDETLQTIYFNDDVIYYDLNSDFDESIFLVYHNSQSNDEKNPWEYRNYQELLQMGNMEGNTFRRYYSVTSINGKKQLVILGKNLLGSVITDPLSVVGSWTAGGDASGLTTDSSNNVKVGSSSLTFTATRNGGSAILQNTKLNWNIFQLIQKGGSVKFWTQLAPATNITNIQLVLSSDTSFTNNYTITVTTDANGMAFLGSTPDKVAFSMLNAVITGTPNPNLIVAAKLIWTLGAGYTTGQIWANDLYFSYPDQMDFGYYTQYKGTDTTGNTKKTMFDALSDIPAIANQYPDFIDMIAMRGAINCYPAILGDPTFYGAYTTQWTDILRVWGRIFPRKRTQNSSYQTVIQR